MFSLNSVGQGVKLLLIFAFLGVQSVKCEHKEGKGSDSEKSEEGERNANQRENGKSM